MLSWSPTAYFFPTVCTLLYNMIDQLEQQQQQQYTHQRTIKNNHSFIPTDKQNQEERYVLSETERVDIALQP